MRCEKVKTKVWLPASSRSYALLSKLDLKILELSRARESTRGSTKMYCGFSQGAIPNDQISLY
ncbi:hypothetical protein DYY65_05820 [Nitrososphaera sp. AFS]|nr:hypothetical protein [Nitrososphaera sp. AFS]